MEPVIRPAVCNAVARMAEGGMEERGAVFTRREVVNFILDLTGYTIDKPLHTLRALEPCFGAGDFLLPVVERLLDAYRQPGKRSKQDFANLTAALRAVLMSGIARLFVAAYSTRMRGGYLRFQAQYLRRIRLPRWRDVAPAIRTALVEAAEKEHVAACNAAAFEMYGLTKLERAALGGNGEGGRHGDQLGKL